MSVVVTSPMTWQTNEAFWISCGAHRLEARAWGAAPAEACTFVLLHEGLGSVAQWKDFPDALAAETGFGVVAYSRAGYGRSSSVSLPRPLDYMTREALDVLPHVLNAVGARQVVLLGHSDGASIAAIHAGLACDVRVRGAVLMAPHFFTEPGGLAAIAAARVAFETRDLRARLAKYHSDPDVAFNGWNDAWLDPDFTGWSIKHVIETIRVPVLGVQGKQDPYGTLAQLTALETRLCSPFHACILDDCRHAPHIEQRETTLAAILSFISRLDLDESRTSAAF